MEELGGEGMERVSISQRGEGREVGGEGWVGEWGAVSFSNGNSPPTVQWEPGPGDLWDPFADPDLWNPTGTMGTGSWTRTWGPMELSSPPTPNNWEPPFY